MANVGMIMQSIICKNKNQHPLNGKLAASDSAKKPPSDAVALLGIGSLSDETHDVHLQGPG
jgi:hypothetical protein